MAPEQIRGEINDRRIDVFSAAVVLWEMLTLRRLFGGTSHANTLNKVLSGVIDKPSRINRDVTPELDAVVMKGLERNPERRFQTARDFALALEEAAPLASPVKLAAWVDALASDALKERAETIEAIERSDHGSTGPAEPTPTTNAGVERSREPGPNETLHEAASTIVFSVPPRRFSGAWLAIAFLVAGLALGAMVFWSPFREQPSSLNRSWSGQRAWPAMTATSVTSPALSAIPSATVTAKRVPAKERGSTSKGRSKDCTPPYTTDARGVQVWKSHCK
jgi:serine/threonine protein kinase